MPNGLAELHLHLYGTIRARDYLDHLGGRRVDWSRYERSYEAAYGARPTIREILERHARGDPTAAREFERLFVFGDADAGNFDRFLAKFDLISCGSAFRDLERNGVQALPDLRREMRFFVERMLADQVRQGVRYAEQRLLFGQDFPIELARELALALLEIYRSWSPQLTARLALSLPRADPWPTWELAQELALGPLGELLSGVDFCAVEEGFPPKDQAELLAEVSSFNDRHPDRALARLYHVGESFRDKSLESAVRWVQEAAELGVERLGHAIALGIDPSAFGPHTRSESVAERRDQLAYDLAHARGLRAQGVAIDPAALDAELTALRGRSGEERLAVVYTPDRLRELRARQDYAMDRVRASGAVVEVCPASNRRIGDIAEPAHHPVHRFLGRGLRVVVGSDDPGIFDVRLQEELEWVARETGVPRSELEASAWRSRSEALSGREARR